MLDKSKVPNNGINIHGSKTLTGVYYAKEANLSAINGTRAFNYGSDTERLANATDGRIKRRVYLTLKTGEQIPQGTFGSGEYAYIADVSGIFDFNKATDEQKNAVKELMADDSPNEFESSVLDAGYYGYLKDDIIVCLDMNIKVKSLGKNIDYGDTDGAPPEIDVKKQKLPRPVKSKKLTKKDSDKLSSVMPALQSKVPSANISGGDLNVDAHEYPKFIKEASGFPNMPSFVHSEHKRLGLDKDAAILDSDTSSEDDSNDNSKRRSKARDKRDSEKSILQDIRSILTSGKLVDRFAAKISDVLKNFIRDSNTFQDSKLVNDQGLNDDESKTQKQEIKFDDTVTDLLKEIEVILRTIATGTDKDKETSKERLQEIMEQTKSMDSDTHNYFTKSINNILTAIKDGTTTPKDVTPKSKSPFVTPEPEVEKKATAKTKADTNTRIEVPKVESKQKNTAIKMVDAFIRPKDQSKKEIASVVKKSEEERTATKKQTITTENGHKMTIPAYTPEPKNMSMMDAIAGSIINRKKDTVVHDAAGNEVSRQAGENKQNYKTALHRKGDEYLGTGNTEKILGKLKSTKLFKDYKKPEKTPISVTPSVKPETITPKAEGIGLQKGDWQKSTTDGMDAVAPESSLLGDAAGVAAGAAGGGVLGKVKKALPYVAGAAIMYGGSKLLDTGLSASGLGKNSVDETADDANWNKMSTWQKMQSGAARGIEKVGSLVGQDTLVNEARAKRISNESNYLNSNQSVSGKIKPALGMMDVKPETQDIASAGIERDITNSSNTAAAPTIINNDNKTTNSSTTKQVMGNTMMTQRNSESAYRNMINKRFSS